MKSAFAVAAVLVFGATSAFAQTPTPQPTPKTLSYYWQNPVGANGPLQFEVAVRGYAADNTARSMAGDSTIEKIEGYVWADKSLCNMGSGTSAPSATPWVGWHFTGGVQSATQEFGRGSITFRIEWQRVWLNGAKVADAQKSVSTNSMRDGERVELDRVTGGGVEGCSTTQVRFEVAAVPRSAYRLGFNRLNPLTAIMSGTPPAARPRLLP